MRARGADVSFRDVKIKIPDWGCEWRHAPEARGGFWEIWKSQWVELSPASGVDGWLSLARGGLATDAHVLGVGDRWKSQNRKNVYLSPYVEEPINSKVIKSFLLNPRSRKCFSCFEIPMLYVYIYTNIMNVLRTGMNMFISRIRIWLWYTMWLLITVLIIILCSFLFQIWYSIL